MVLNLPHHCNTTGSPVQGFPNFQQDPLAVLVPLMIPKAEFFDPSRVQKLCSPSIALNLLRHAVLKAIQLDRQLCRGAIEVEVVAINFMLAAEFESSKAAGFQGVPKLFFLVGLIAAQQPGERFWGSPSP
jgi:hypothetical protein